MRPPNVRLALAAASFAAWLVICLPVSADDFAVGPPNSGWKGDSALHTYCYGVGFDLTLRDNASWAMQNSLDRDTDMTDQIEGCLQAQTDVEFLDANLPAGVRGQYTCPNKLNANTCSHSHVTVDPAELNIGNLDEEDTTKTMCHEVGHSVGLTHGAFTDCMRNGEIPNALEEWRTYNGHHRFHINSTY